MSTPPPPQPSRAAFVFVFITVVLDMLALGIVAPVLPRLVTSLQGNDYGDAATMIGLFGFGWAAMQFIFSPVMGLLSDRFGRRPVIVISNLGLGLDYIVMALAPTVGWLFVGRLISGVTAATFATAGAYIADVTPPEQRAAKFGMLGAAFGLGFILGPALGGFLGQIDLRLPFYVAAGCGVLNALYGYFVLPESLPPNRRVRFDWRRANPIGSLRLLQSHPLLIWLASAAFLQRIAHDALPHLLVLYTDYRYGWSVATVGTVLAAIGIGSMIVSAGLTGPLVKRFGERKMMIFGMIVGSLGLFTYGAAGSGAVFLIGLPLIALWGLANPTMNAMMSARVSPSEQGQLQGALSSLSGVAGMVGPILVTQAFATGVAGFGGRPLPGLPYFVASGLVVLALFLAMRTNRSPT
jgi:DHA1 family tetracycline resistance protein-like MFS transporter